MRPRRRAIVSLGTFLLAISPGPLRAHGGGGGGHGGGHGGHAGYYGSGSGGRSTSGLRPEYMFYPQTGPIYPPTPLIPENLPATRVHRFVNHLLGRPEPW